VRDIGSRRELFVDDYLIEEMNGVELRLCQPIRREVVLAHDQPWEGNASMFQRAQRQAARPYTSEPLQKCLSLLTANRLNR